MCGIAGVVGLHDPLGATSAVERMVDTLRRRGPDSGGMRSWAGAVLGHRRLAIFDLSAAGAQPMVSQDGATAVVFNGAIYNFPELRTELLKRGCSFQSDTDTEVLVHGYREWGIDVLVSRLRGMFAFALWDDEKHRLLLVRDRLGIKPLVYALDNGSLAFASTARALRAGGLAREIDPQAIAEFLEFGYVTEERSIYRQVAKVPPATIIEFSNGEIRSRKYWTPPSPGSAEPVPFEHAVEEVERLLLRAVELRLHADVPVGALLSGGIDSSLVCWAVAKLGGNVTAYTVGAPGDPSDETFDAEATARELGITHRVLDVTGSRPDEIEELVSAYAEPFGAPSALGMIRVSEAVSSEAKVLLTGDGGDDVFLGYPRHRHLRFAQSLARLLPAPAASAWYRLRRLAPRAGPAKRAVHFLDYVTGGLGAFLHAHDGLPMYQQHGILAERLLDARLSQREIAWSSASARRVLLDYLEHDLRTQFVAEYLTKVDGATMYFGLEARSPFFDQELWEYAAALPVEIRLRGGELKAVLRELARRRISERVASGKKRGFSIPVQRWIAGRWRQTMEERMRDSLLARGGWINPQAVLRVLAATPNGAEAPLQLWYLLVLEEWMRHESAVTDATNVAEVTRSATASGAHLSR